MHDVGVWYSKRFQHEYSIQHMGYHMLWDARIMVDGTVQHYSYSFMAPVEIDTPEAIQELRSEMQPTVREYFRRAREKLILEGSPEPNYIT